jgi:carbonic anhydrase
MKAHSKESQNLMTPESSLTSLVEGNTRFQQNLRADRNLLEQVKTTSTGQFPFATILSCIDSRVSSELIFDQGIGDLFSITDVLGSMEFACKLAGTKLLVVLGHTACGAVKGACDDAKLGNLTSMLAKIKPAVEATIEPADASIRNSSNTEFVNDVSTKNVELTIDYILENSPVLKEMQSEGSIKVIGAMYDITSGKVTFYE